MKNINLTNISSGVYKLCLRANLSLRKDVKIALEKAVKKETKSVSKKMLRNLIENYKIAENERLPVCQDTGMVVVFLKIGKGINLDFSRLEEYVNKGVAKAYKEGFFRKSIVNDPLTRENTGNNLPAIIHYEFTKNKGLEISVLIKGFGAENKSQLRMMNPTASEEDIIDYVVEVVRKAGPDACPPYFLGIGIGGTMDKAALLSKKSLLQDVSKLSKDEKVAKLQRKILKKINGLNIGVLGLGGKATCLGVNILTYPTHIAGLPVAVNLNCHALRSACKRLLDVK